MSGKVKNADSIPAQRVSLILEQLDELPTLSAIAVRLLDLTSAAESDAQEVIQLVSSDPALAGKVLALCRCSEKGRASNVNTIERAVLLLGFDALRSAVLSVQVFEVFDQVTSPGGEQVADEMVFDRVAFWQHSLAVAELCDSLAGKLPQGDKDAKGEEASLVGLLHDLGVLTLHLLLPSTFERTCKLTETHNVSLDHACKQIIGIDTHTIGKHLAEHWNLPEHFRDVMWLHGQNPSLIPDLPHKKLIDIVTLADVLARQHYITPIGHGMTRQNPEAISRTLGLTPEALQEVLVGLSDRVQNRATGLGLSVDQDRNLLVCSLSRANQALARVFTAARKQTLNTRRQVHTLQQVKSFQDSLDPGLSVVRTLGCIVQSAAGSLGGSFYATLYQPPSSDCWEKVHFSPDGKVISTKLIQPPPDTEDISELLQEMNPTVRAVSMFPWLLEYLSDAPDPAEVRVFPIGADDSPFVMLLHDSDGEIKEDEPFDPLLLRMWASAVTTATLLAGSQQLGEQLAETARTLEETQITLTETQMLAQVGEIAAGAAHEMNNPLAIISGRAQLLADQLRDPEQCIAAEQIIEQSHRLSNLITALHEFANPAQPQMRPINLSEMVFRIVQHYTDNNSRRPQEINTMLPPDLPPVWIDSDLMTRALGELVRNALEAKGTEHIDIRIQTDPVDDRLKIQITDDGIGLDQHTLDHAFDPFFSAKSAGRQPGLGLARVRRIVEAHDGLIELANGPGGGAVATIWLPGWRGENHEQRSVA